MFRNTFIFLAFFLAFSPTALAQELHEDVQEIVKAEVVEISGERVINITGTDASTTVQTVVARITEGSKAGDLVTFENDLVMVEPGDKIYLNYTVTINGDEYYYLKDVDRQLWLYFLFGVFVLLLLWFARWQGMRALLSLSLSIAAILFVLIPLMLAGYNPVLVSLSVAGVILALVLFGTHGFNPSSCSAFIGTFSAVLVTSVVALFFVSALALSGFGSDASVYLNFATDGQLDFAGLLLGSIIIGILGVLDDVAITQASVVQELKLANSKLNIQELYNRALRVGRDHVGSLVNTLALAYVGAALPLVLLFSTSEAPLGLTLNQEVIAAEIARIIIGSIGLILAVPFTTFIAAWWFGTHGVDEGSVSSHSHHHHH